MASECPEYPHRLYVLLVGTLTIEKETFRLPKADGREIWFESRKNFLYVIPAIEPESRK